MIPQLHRRAAEATLALAMLTRLPVPQLRDCPPVGASAWAWPLAGAVVGGLQAAVLLAAAAVLPPVMAAGLALAAGLLLTGALHEDGLADLADGLSGGQTPAQRLEIMKDSRIGSHGAVALITALGLRWAAFAAIATWSPAAAFAALIAAQAASRAGLGLMNLAGPQARAQGFAAAATDGLTATQAATAIALATALALATLPFLQALTLLAAVTLTQLLLLRHARRRLGGITGDVLGAAQITAEIAALATVVA